MARTVERRVIGLHPDQEQRRILVVDDKVDNRALLTHLLGRIGLETREAVNGVEALEVFEAWKPHCVLMDMKMPVMDGYTATRIIRCWEHEQGLDPTPILALTANAFAEDVHKSMEAGCTGHINKPIRRAPLMAEIAECTNGGSQ